MHNFLLIHLESLNYANYHMNQELFLNLHHWEQKSLSFKNYFSTATSTWMVVADLLYGNMLQYESCDQLVSQPKKYRYKESMFDRLKSEGYQTKLMICGEDGGSDFDGVSKKHIAGFQNKIDVIKNDKDYLLEVERVFQGTKPFALMCFNFISNVSFNCNLPYRRLKSGFDRWEDGYRVLDIWVGDILQLLEKNHLQENTTIIFYGDHGDDYFEHGLHNGLTHAIEPYANLIHTPFWIYDSRLVDKGICNDLVSTIDIRTIAEKLLHTPYEKFSWRQLNVPTRSYCFARNAYAAQPVRCDSFNKGYCITDGRILILVSCHGLEMYHVQMDAQCQNDLLRFFSYKNGILHLNEKLNDSLRFHYKSIFNMGSLRQIRQTFYFYRKKLFDETMELFENSESETQFEKLNFQSIRNWRASGKEFF